MQFVYLQTCVPLYLVSAVQIVSDLVLLSVEMHKG